MKHLLQVSMVVVAVAVVPAGARAGQFRLIQVEPLLPYLAVAHHASKPHSSHPRTSPSHSTPHHQSTPKVSKPSTSTKPTTTSSTKPTTTSGAGNGNSTRTTNTKNSTTTRNYSSRITTQNFFGSGSSYSGGYSYRSSRYSRHHHRHNIVRGIVSNKTGTGASGSVQVKVMRKSASRFRNRNGAGAGAGIAAGNNTGNNTNVHTYQVNNQTRYAHVTNARGGMRASSFKELEPGKPVMILTPKAGNHHAVAIEIWPHTKR